MRRYVEPARTYISTLVILAAIIAGFLIDLLVIGGGGVHALAWAVGGVIVVGADALIVYAVRQLRSIVVTDEELRVGEESLRRDEIAGVELARNHDDPEVPIVGRRYGEGLPRGTAAVTLRLTDGRTVAIATRHPQRLAEVLAAPDVVPEVRRAVPSDLERLPEIDRRAESLFHVSGIDLPDIPFPIDALHESRAVFVAGRPPVGFVQLDEVDGRAHIQELAVLPSHMRQGLGSALLDAACDWAREVGYPAITLTTYADVAWNARFYAAHGFVELAQLSPELKELRDWERDVGLDAIGRRIAMCKDLAENGAETPVERGG